jgi:hypothetical protein
MNKGTREQRNKGTIHKICSKNMMDLETYIGQLTLLRPEQQAYMIEQINNRLRESSPICVKQLEVLI